MRRESAGRSRPELQPWPAPAFAPDGSKGGGVSWKLLLALLAFGISSCKAVPVVSHVLPGEKAWNEIEDMCSAIPAIDTLPQPSNALEEFCFMVLEIIQNDKTSVTHPVLPLIPQPHEWRQKRYKADEELRIPGGVQSRGYFMFRPRNGRRSATFY